MRVLPEPITFEWDSGNKDKSVVKHNISNKETEEIFLDKQIFVIEDAKHSKKEKRFHALGKTRNRKILFISFTLRRDKVRVISARPASRKEVKIYEKT